MVSGCTSTVATPIVVTVYLNPAPPTIRQNGNLLTASPLANGYQWYFNGGIIPGATSQSNLASPSGNFAVVITDISGCASSQSVIYNFVGI